MFGAPAVPAVPPLVDASPVQFKRNMDFFITHLGEEPLQMYCPTCRTNVLTNIDYKFGGLACLISLFCLPCLCCCCIPCITSKYKNVRHFCPNCNSMIGTKHLLNR